MGFLALQHTVPFTANIQKPLFAKGVARLEALRLQASIKLSVTKLVGQSSAN